MIGNLTQLKTKDIPKVRSELLENQNNCCAICGESITDKSGVSLDHQHKLKSDIPGPDGAGLIRGVLDRKCNVLEGKIWNAMTRYIQPKCVQERISFLQSLIDYYERGTYDLIHPNEAPKLPDVSKKNYNKLKKIYDGKKRFPEYPKSKKLTLGLQILFEKYNIKPYN